MLKNRVLAGIVLLALIIAPTIAKAQEMPFGKWWHNASMSKQLNLSQAEKNLLDDAFRESRRKLIDLKSRVEREQFELENLLESPELDQSAVMGQFKRLEQARTDLSAERFRFLLQIRETLGQERFRHIKTFHGKLRKHRIKRGTQAGEEIGGPSPGSTHR